VTAYDLENKSEVMISRGHPLFIRIPDLAGSTCCSAICAAPLVLYIVGQVKKDASMFDAASKAMFITLMLQAAGLAIFVGA